VAILIVFTPIWGTRLCPLRCAEFHFNKSIFGCFRPKNTKSREIYKLCRSIGATALLDLGEIYVVYAWFPTEGLQIWDVSIYK